MALPPTIPTSFVPYSASSSARRFRADYSGAFGFFAYLVFFVALTSALGVFFYGRILDATQAAKDAALSKAEAAVDPATVKSFLQLHNRLTSGEQLLAKHLALSDFFALLTTIMPTDVSFSSLHLSLDSTGAVQVEGSGTAKNFNTLAATSIAFAADGRIKNAIFSNIAIRKDNSVTFGFTSTLDPKLVAFVPPATTASTTSASTTSASTTATSSASLP